MATGDAFTQFSTLLDEVKDDAIRNLVLEREDIFWRLIDSMDAFPVAGRQTSSTPGDATNLEARWEVLHQHGGLITAGTLSGNTLQRMGADNVNFTGQTADALYPDPEKSPLRSFLEIRMYLKRMKGVLSVNREQVISDILAKGMREVVMANAEDATRLVRDLFSNLAWHQGNGIMAQVNLAAGYSVGEGSNRKSVVVDAGTIHRFVIGQRYVATSLSSGSPSGGTTRDGSLHQPGVMRCVDIDLDSEAVVLEAEPGEGTISLSDNDALIQEGVWDFVSGASRAFNGVESLLLGSGGGSYPGTSYDVDSHFRLRAWVDDNESAPEEPEMRLISNIVDKQLRAGIDPPNLVIADPSVWSRWDILERQTNAVVQVPMGSPFQAAGGVGGPSLTHGSWTAARADSSRIRPNAIYGLAMDTFIKFMPAGKVIQWLNEQGGVADTERIFRLVTKGTQATHLSSAEFDFFCQLGQTMPRRCFRILGVKSQLSVDG